MSILNKKPYFQSDFGVFKVKIYHSNSSVRNCYLTIDIPNTGEYHHIPANDRLYGQCLLCAEKQDATSLRRFIDIYLLVTSMMYYSQESLNAFSKLADDLIAKEFQQAAIANGTFIPKQEETDEAIMREAIEYANMPKKERKRRKKAMEEELKEIINEESEETANDNG
jgi:hypothetical protein